jgi:hypothetical protein
LAALLIPVALVAMFSRRLTRVEFLPVAAGFDRIVAWRFSARFRRQYCSFRDIYGLAAPHSGAGSGADDQLLA